MTIEYILLIIFAFVLFYLNSSKKCSKEAFQAENEKCEFIPWGPSKRACIDRCRVDRSLWGGDACSQAKCYEICESCTDNEKCKWLNTRDFLEEERQKQLEEASSEINIELRGIEGDHQCVINFFHNEEIPMYILKYYESANPNAGVKVFYVKSPGKGLNTINISNLKNKIQYSFILVPIKDRKQLKPSNIVELIPNSALHLRGI